MLVRLAPRVRKGRAAQPELRAKLDRRASVFVLVQSTCVSGNCTITCRENEVLVTAYCGPNRNAATYLAASCGVAATAANGPLVVVCVGAPQ
jgi:hypothetical protein